MNSYRAGTCTVGSNCCGSSVYYSVYRNPNLVGCYEPAIPGTQLAGTATYPVACFSTVYTQTIVPTRIYVLANPSGTYYPTNTAPGQYDWSLSVYGMPQYEYLGCYKPSTFTVVKSVANSTITPQVCGAYCAGYTFFAISENNQIGNIA